MLINIKTPDGYTSEIQFHIPESLIMKESYLGNETINRYRSEKNETLEPFKLTEDIYDLTQNNFSQTEELLLDALNKQRLEQ
jgi:hypothetical protein